ncbi:MAG: hypothetical protein JRJ85_18680 [Deltaproteobacteria bacterium]|nr:hypothetical protein [Deltaproteobacteria bacterium]
MLLPRYVRGLLAHSSHILHISDYFSINYRGDSQFCDDSECISDIYCSTAKERGVKIERGSVFTSSKADYNPPSPLKDFKYYSFFGDILDLRAASGISILIVSFSFGSRSEGIDVLNSC